MRYLSIILALLAYGAMAQEPDDIDRLLTEEEKDTIRQRLVQLAWENNPEKDVLQGDVRISQYGVNKARNNWFSSLIVSGNLNELSINPPSDETFNIFYPRYNFSLVLPLGTVLNNPQDVKIAKEQVRIDQAALDGRKLEIRQEVLSAFEDYLMYEEMLKIQRHITVHEQTHFHHVETSYFNSESVSEQDYEDARRSYNNERFKEIQMNNDWKKSRIKLETLIGMGLEAVGL